MNIRECKLEDAAAVARVFTESVRDIDAADYSLEQLAAWAPGRPDMEYWRDQLGRLIGFVAEIDSEIVGFVTFEPNGHLHHLYVCGAFQRRGVATALCRRVEQEALAGGVHVIFVEASITARPFFERMGFETIVQQEVMHRGVWFTNFRMERVLL
jgi:putative acetyltransferase